MSIELKDVTYTYSPGTAYEIHALKNINLSIPDGQFIGVIGHTGSGKSTLIQHLNALIQPTSGTILYNGEDVWEEKYDRRVLRSQVGLVFQYPEHQLFESDVLSDVCFGPMNQGLTREEAEKEAKKALEQVGFKEKNYGKSPFELSGGQKKRVAIAGVLAMSPQILIFDESTSMLDPQGKAEINELIQEIHKESNITIISITHDIEEVSKSDYVIVMDGGHVVMKGLPDDILRKEKELIALQLDIPFALKFTKAMRAHGVDMKDCTTMEKVVDEVCRLHFKK